ncbi:MAG: peptidoglycan DD-metalloendopeptidase family protein [Pseudomonadales bacterium]|nr:peptidoglycan DD-metalloendopeptidase family protein [Pseudomonadales bacterium]
MKPRSFPLANGLNPIYRIIVYLFALPSVAAVPIGFPGGVVEVIVPPSTTTVSFNDIPQLRLDNRAIVALPLTTKPGDHVVIAHAAKSATELPFKVMAKTYREQHLTLENPRLVDPLASDLQRIEAESLQMRRAYNLVSRMPTHLRPIRLPVQGIVTSEFGFRRFFNGQPRSPHSGVDIAAAQGTPVKSPARGFVVVVGNFFFNGNTVLVDHGGGFISMLCHLSEVNVKQQQRIEKDSIIGTVGATGRATGPHLHWSVSLQGIRVDPLVFIDVINASANAE